MSGVKEERQMADWRTLKIDPQGERVRFLEGLLQRLGQDATVLQAIEYVRGEKLQERGAGHE
jgi:hypothetical protein